MVTIEYTVAPERVADFSRAMQPVRVIRLRDGAIFWSLFFDSERPARFVEYFLVESWLEHLRQHERAVQADVELEQHARSFHIEPTDPAVSHQVSVESINGLNAEFFIRASLGLPLKDHPE